MSSAILRSRLASGLSKRCYRRLLSSDVVSGTPKEPLAPSSATIASATSSTSTTSSSSAPNANGNAGDSAGAIADQAPSGGSNSKGWRFLKYSLVGALIGATATAGYATYAYTTDEIDEKTKALRASANVPMTEDSPAVEKFQGFLYSAAMTAMEFYLDLRRRTDELVLSYSEPYAEKLLPDLLREEQHIFTLVLDLQETLIHYDWTREKGWQTFKRPGVDAFLEHLAQFFEIVVYSDEQNMFVDPVVERLNTKGCIRYKLCRAATKYKNGKHYRDLSKLNRDPAKVLYLSGHALENCLQQENAVPIKPWKKDDANDTALLDFIPFLEVIARTGPADVRKVLESYKGCDIPTEYIRRTKDYQRRVQEQKQHGRFWKQTRPE